MSRKIVQVFWSWYNSGIDRTEIRALIECDTLTDLPSQDAITGYRLTIGTTAHVIDTNAVYMMQSGGAWKVQSAGTDVYTKSETDALIQDSKDYADGLIAALDVSSVGGTTRYIYQISETNGKISASSYASDTTPTAGSTKLVQSDGIKTYVDTAVSDKITITNILGAGQRIEATADAPINLNDLTAVGRYNWLSRSTAYMTPLPVSGKGGLLEVSYIQGSSTILHKVYLSDGANSPTVFYQRFRYGSGTESSPITWTGWYKFEGVPV